MIVRVATTIPNGINYKDTPASKSFDLLRSNEKITFQNIVVVGAGVGRNRNKCVTKKQNARQDKFDFDIIIFVDADIEYEPWQIYSLTHSRGEVVGASVHRKENPKQIHAGNWDFGIVGYVGSFLSSEDTGVHSVKWVTSMFKIHESVFSKIEYPYFRYPIIQYEDQRENASPDAGFYAQLDNAGIPVLVDCGIRPVHHDLNKETCMPEEQKPQHQLSKFDSDRLQVLDWINETCAAIKTISRENIALRKEIERLKSLEPQPSEKKSEKS